MVDPGLLASAVVAVLAPLLRHLLKLGGEKAAEAVGEKVGGGAVDRLWAKLKPKVEAKAGAAEAAEEVAKSPNDEDAKEELELHLKRILKADPELAAEVERLVEEAGGSVHMEAHLEGDGAIAQASHGGKAVAAGKGGIAIGGSVHGGLRPGRGGED